MKYPAREIEDANHYGPNKTHPTVIQQIIDYAVWAHRELELTQQTLDNRQTTA